MRRICTFALHGLVMTTFMVAGAQAQTTPEQTAHRRHYGTIPSPTRHLGEIRPRQDRLGTLRGPQGSLIQPSPIPYFGSGFVMQATKKPPDAAPAATAQAQSPPESPSQPSKNAGYPPIDRPNGIPLRILACWSPPTSSGEMEVTVRLSFSRAGEVVGQPRITYVKAGGDDVLRKAISASILAAIQSCAPLRFTPGLGQAIAGRSFAIRFIAPAVRKPATSI
ncbi:hypothetical protein PY365_07275 [Roseiarcaceae bacterium H3SJ34-1]|uniref:hypothetical protein n=1 Tax=Terripilifer ovatus TaxID=3032367 RepID=UPI003AB96C52|nr:hypothetical protein [Roseiarcaceae bacterium H3SJ34-1]